MALKPMQKELFDNGKAETGAIIRKPGSKRLYILFMYFGRRVEKSTGLNDTEDNRDKARKGLNRILTELKTGKTTFAKAFPGASDEEKAFFAKHEGWTYAPSPNEILIGDYIDRWLVEVVENYDHGNRFDYQQITKCWIRPYFQEKTFHQLTKLEVKKFIGTLLCKIGPNKGKPVSKSRAGNVVTVLTTMFNDAVDEYHWNIPYPFRKISKHFPNKPPKERGIFRFTEWLLILEAIEPWYRPMLEFMMLTGTIHSEVAGLRRRDISSTHISFRESIVRKIKNDALKTTYRTRQMPLTTRLKAILEEVLSRTDSDYVFAEPDGSPYDQEEFRKRYWVPAVNSTLIPYRPPYSIRHSFAAYCLLIRIEPLRLVKLMGHGSKQMVFEVYGNYLEGIEEDSLEILEYFGRDFVEVKRTPLSFCKNLHCESLVKARGEESVTT